MIVSANERQHNPAPPARSQAGEGQPCVEVLDNNKKRPHDPAPSVHTTDSKMHRVSPAAAEEPEIVSLSAERLDQYTDQQQQQQPQEQQQQRLQQQQQQQLQQEQEQQQWRRQEQHQLQGQHRHQQKQQQQQLPEQQVPHQQEQQQLQQQQQQQKDESENIGASHLRPPEQLASDTSDSGAPVGVPLPHLPRGISSMSKEPHTAPGLSDVPHLADRSDVSDSEVPRDVQLRYLRHGDTSWEAHTAKVALNVRLDGRIVPAVTGGARVSYSHVAVLDGFSDEAVRSELMAFLTEPALDHYTSAEPALEHGSIPSTAAPSLHAQQQLHTEPALDHSTVASALGAASQQHQQQQQARPTLECEKQPPPPTSAAADDVLPRDRWERQTADRADLPPTWGVKEHILRQLGSSHLAAVQVRPPVCGRCLCGRY